MKKNLIIALLLSAVLACGVFAGCKKAVDPAGEDLSCTVQLTSAVEGITLDKSVEVTVPAGSTVFDALLATTWAVVSSDSQYGKFVEGIDDVMGTDHTGWVYYVNGESAMDSCSEHAVVAGDVYKWELISW